MPPSSSTKKKHNSRTAATKAEIQAQKSPAEFFAEHQQIAVRTTADMTNMDGLGNSPALGFVAFCWESWWRESMKGVVTSCVVVSGDRCRLLYIAFHWNTVILFLMARGFHHLKTN